MKQKKWIRSYLRRVSRAARCSPGRKRRLVRELEASIELFLEDCPGAGLWELEKEFGSPEEIAQCFLEQEEGAGFRYLPFLSRLALVGFALYFAAFSSSTGLRSCLSPTPEELPGVSPAPEEPSDRLSVEAEVLQIKIKQVNAQSSARVLVFTSVSEPSPASSRADHMGSVAVTTSVPEPKQAPSHGSTSIDWSGDVVILTQSP